MFSIRLLSVGCIVLTASCHGLLDVTNPTLVKDADIANAAGANARRLDVSASLNSYAGQVAVDVAFFTDEWRVDMGSFVGEPIVSDFVFLDRRDSQGYEQNHTYLMGGNTDDPHLGNLDWIVTKADIALPSIRAYAPDSLKGDFLAHVFAIKAYAVLQMAEDICSGFPINEVQDNGAVFRPPYTTDSAIKYGVALADSALAHARDSTRFLNFARVLRGRALLDLGQYAAAATAVHDVPTDFVYLTEPRSNGVFRSPNGYCGDPDCQNLVLGDHEGGNGLGFVSAHDSRVPTVAIGTSLIQPADSVYVTTKYASVTSPMVVAGGVEARLIEAEVALNAGDPSWFATLNTLRATMVSPAMSAMTTMPATMTAQLDLLYSERAFWLYLTGRRLGDLRRMIRNYGRDPETIFPTGAYSAGGTYDPATAIPFVLATEAAQNPYLTSGCAVR